MPVLAALPSIWLGIVLEISSLEPPLKCRGPA